MLTKGIIVGNDLDTNSFTSELVRIHKSHII